MKVGPKSSSLCRQMVPRNQTMNKGAIMKTQKERSDMLERPEDTDHFRDQMLEGQKRLREKNRDLENEDPDPTQRSRDVLELGRRRFGSSDKP